MSVRNLPEEWQGLKYMTAQWLINYHMAKIQREVYHVFICYKGGLVFVCMSPCLCYGDGEVSQREVTWWNSGWGWIDYRLEWSFHVSAEVILLQGFIFILTLRSQCSTAVLRAAKTWNKPIPTMQNIKNGMTEILREVVHDPPQHFWNSISKLLPKGCILSLKRSSFSADFQGKHLVPCIKIFSRIAAQLQALKCSELPPE